MSLEACPNTARYHRDRNAVADHRDSQRATQGMHPADPPPNPRTSLLVDQGRGFKTVSSSTNYRNQGFCFPFEVNATYTNIEASGSGTGGLTVLSGSGLTAHTGNQLCAPLIDRNTLVRRL